METYFIKKEYRHKEQNTTLDTNRADQYWSEDKVPLSQMYQRQVYLYAAELVKTRGLTSVLDVGCGPGIKLMEIVKPVSKKVLGIDQAGAVLYGKKKFGDQYFVADDFEKPTFITDQKFDLIICSDVIEHLKDPDLLLSYITRFVHFKTLVLFSTPERDILRGKDNLYSPNKDHVREWNREEFLAYLESRGFKVKEWHLFNDLAFTLSRFYFSQALHLWGRNKHCLAVLATHESSHV